MNPIQLDLMLTTIKKFNKNLMANVNIDHRQLSEMSKSFKKKSLCEV